MRSWGGGGKERGIKERERERERKIKEMWVGGCRHLFNITLQESKVPTLQTQKKRGRRKGKKIIFISLSVRVCWTFAKDFGVKSFFLYW